MYNKKSYTVKIVGKEKSITACQNEILNNDDLLCSTQGIKVEMFDSFCMIFFSSTFWNRFYFFEELTRKHEVLIYLDTKIVGTMESFVFYNGEMIFDFSYNYIEDLAELRFGAGTIGSGGVESVVFKNYEWRLNKNENHYIRK